jgi:hypothetical protein
MQPRIAISRKGLDDGILQLEFLVCDGVSTFVSESYSSGNWGVTAAAALRVFATQIYGGIYTLEAGAGGREYAGGAFRARFHYFKPTQLLISTRQQGDYFDFKRSEVAAQVAMFLRTEPALLDRFIGALPALDSEVAAQAVLECVPLPAR